MVTGTFHPARLRGVASVPPAKSEAHRALLLAALGRFPCRLHETLDGDPYETDIYAWQGAMWESFQAVGDPFAPENGEQLVDLQSLTFTLLSPTLLEASVVMPDGENRTLRMALRAGMVQEAN